MVRLLCALALMPCLGAAPALAAVRLGTEGEVHSLAVSRGAALAVVESGDAAEPFGLVRSAGRSVADLGAFGRPGSEFPAVATDAAGAPLVSYALPVSGGNVLMVQQAPARPAQAFGDPLAEVFATGPGRLAADAAATAVLAHPDRVGDAMLTRSSLLPTYPEPPFVARPLTASAPERRHLPLDVAVTAEDALVLDLIQERRRTELRVLGAGAPSTALLSVRALRHFPARMAVDGERIAVAYLSRGRAYLARGRIGSGAWTRRRLPGAGGDGAPAPLFMNGDAYVAYTKRVRARRGRAQRDVFLAGPGRTRRLTRTPGDERDPLAAAGPDGTAYVAWTRREPRRGPTSAFLQRVD